MVNEGSQFMIKANKKSLDNPTYISTKAPLRMKVLEFINSKRKVNLDDLNEFLNQLTEDLGRTPSVKWVDRNKDLVECQQTEDGKIYSLTKKGKDVLSAHRKFESFRDSLKKQILTDLKLKNPDIANKIEEDLDFTEDHKIIKFVSERGSVNLSDLRKYCKNENVNFSIKAVNRFLKKELGKKGVVEYTLSSKGKEMLESLK